MKVKFQGNEYTLTQEAHCEVPSGSAYDWMATAINSSGQEFMIYWQEYECFDGDDCSNACDWETPCQVIEL